MQGTNGAARATALTLQRLVTWGWAPCSEPTASPPSGNGIWHSTHSPTLAEASPCGPCHSERMSYDTALLASAFEKILSSPGDRFRLASSNTVRLMLDGTWTDADGLTEEEMAAIRRVLSRTS